MRAPRRLQEVSLPDPTVEVGREIAEALRDIAKAINHHTAQRKDVDEFWGDVGKKCDSTWRFVVNNRVKLLATVPVVLVTVGAVSPNAAGLLGSALRAMLGNLS